MARLPSVKLVHRRRREIRIVNLPDYALDLGRWSDWAIVSVRHGDASDAAVRNAIRESEINICRLRDPAEQAWRKDHERAQQARRLEPGSTRDADQAATSGAARARPAHRAPGHSYLKRIIGAAPVDQVLDEASLTDRG